MQLNILKMSRIPKIEKFRADSYMDFKIWIPQFERHLRALEIENYKKLYILFYCVEGTVFSYLYNLRVADANITSAQIKDEFEQRFCGDEYKRNL